MSQEAGVGGTDGMSFAGAAGTLGPGASMQVADYSSGDTSGGAISSGSAGGNPGVVISEAFRVCRENTDCVHVAFYRDVTAKDECYCPLCPSNWRRLPAVNRELHKTFEEHWQRLCASWAEGECEDSLCGYPPEPYCAQGLCQYDYSWGPRWELLSSPRDQVYQVGAARG
jgi:hypothetical protein